MRVRGEERKHERPFGYVGNPDDCDDASAAFSPAAPETDCADPNDYNCDGSTGYADADADGFAACEDCNDADAARNPAAAEVCDGIDNDCDGSIDVRAVDEGTWFADTDGDGFGDPSVTVSACDASDGYVADATDCDDTNPSVHPLTAEVCDGIDDDCDGTIDQGATDAAQWYPDWDGDGSGDASAPTTACDEPTGYAADGLDCDDADAGVHRGAVEACNGVDDDCDGVIDEACDDGASEDRKGCGCSAVPATSGAAIAMLAVLMVGARRRR